MAIEFELAEVKDTDPNAQCNIALWLIEDNVNIAWHQYLINVVHLRQAPGVKPAKLFVPGVTHEMMCFALDPSNGDYTVDDIEKAFPNRLEPINMVYQFTAEHDAAAFGYIEGLLRRAPSVDTDFRQWWTHRICHVGGGVSG